MTDSADRSHHGQCEDLGPNTWLAKYNPPYTEQNDTDIAGQSIIQLSSEAFRDSFKSAWRSAAKQSPLQCSVAFITQTPQPSMNYNRSVSAHCFLVYRVRRGKTRLTCLSPFPRYFSFSMASRVQTALQSSLIPNSICKYKFMCICCHLRLCMGLSEERYNPKECRLLERLQLKTITDSTQKNLTRRPTSKTTGRYNR